MANPGEMEFMKVSHKLYFIPRPTSRVVDKQRTQLDLSKSTGLSTSVSSAFPYPNNLSEDEIVFSEFSFSDSASFSFVPPVAPSPPLWHVSSPIKGPATAFSLAPLGFVVSSCKGSLPLFQKGLALHSSRLWPLIRQKEQDFGSGDFRFWFVASAQTFPPPAKYEWAYPERDQPIRIL